MQVHIIMPLPPASKNLGILLGTPVSLFRENTLKFQQGQTPSLTNLQRETPNNESSGSQHSSRHPS